MIKKLYIAGIFVTILFFTILILVTTWTISIMMALLKAFICAAIIVIAGWGAWHLMKMISSIGKRH